MGRDSDSPGTPLAELLAPHLDKLEPPAPEQPSPPPRRRLDEGELMALIFAHLDVDNPRVCEGIDFERLEIFAQLPGEAQPEPRAEPDAKRAPARVGEPGGATLEPSASPAAAALTLDWVGRSWADDITTVPGELLDRPTLDEDQRRLLARAAGRRCASLNLRRLARAPALRHLELFVHACQAEGVRLCRVITGKGIDSSREPVLKRAVLEWCLRQGRERVRGCAPELDRHGEWGVLVIQLRAG